MDDNAAFTQELRAAGPAEPVAIWALVDKNGQPKHDHLFFGKGWTGNDVAAQQEADYLNKRHASGAPYSVVPLYRAAPSRPPAEPLDDRAGLEAEVMLLREALQERNRLIGEPPAGSHEDEQWPRALTWHAERANWEAEVKRLRDYIAELQARAAPSRPVPWEVCAKIADDVAAEYAQSMQAAIKTHSDAGAGHAIGARSAAETIASRIRATAAIAGGA